MKPQMKRQNKRESVYGTREYSSSSFCGRTGPLSSISSRPGSHNLTHDHPDGSSEKRSLGHHKDIVLLDDDSTKLWTIAIMKTPADAYSLEELVSELTSGI